MAKKFGTVTVGETLPPVTGTITQETINDYADMSEDYNPLHVDVAYGRSTPYGSTIAHGPIALDFAVQMVKAWLGVAWPRGVSVKGRFIAAVKPGDAVTARGRVIGLQAASARATCEFVCENQRGEPVITGEIECPLER